jgi:flagellar FliL protein
MSDETPEDPSSGRKAPGKGVLIALTLAMLAAGGGTGALVLAPRLAARGAGEGDSLPPTDRTHGPASAGDGKGPMLRLENIIVNPAGSQGTRFLMTTVALQVADEATRTRLLDHEVEVRDTLVATLESQTLEALTRPGAREALKRHLAEAVQPLAGSGARVRVYLPQFVIQ